MVVRHCTQPQHSNASQTARHADTLAGGNILQYITAMPSLTFLHTDLALIRQVVALVLAIVQGVGTRQWSGCLGHKETYSHPATEQNTKPAPVYFLPGCNFALRTNTERTQWEDAMQVHLHDLSVRFQLHLTLGITAGRQHKSSMPQTVVALHKHPRSRTDS
jgi:hypothetical protein